MATWRNPHNFAPDDQESVVSAGATLAAADVLRMISDSCLQPLGFEIKSMQSPPCTTIVKFQREETKLPFWKGTLMVSDTIGNHTVESGVKSITIRPVLPRVFVLVLHPTTTVKSGEFKTAKNSEPLCFFLRSDDPARPYVWTLSGSVANCKRLLSANNKWNSWGLLAASVGTEALIEFNTSTRTLQVNCRVYGGVTIPLSSPFDTVANEEYASERERDADVVVDVSSFTMD